LVRWAITSFNNRRIIDRNLLFDAPQKGRFAFSWAFILWQFGSVEWSVQRVFEHPRLFLGLGEGVIDRRAGANGLMAGFRVILGHVAAF
jgi:hypothetical protein